MAENARLFQCCAALSQLATWHALLRSKVAAASLQVQVTSDNAAHKYPIRVLVPYELVAVGMIVACWCALSSTAKVCLV